MANTDQSSTIKYYDQNAEEFIRNTLNVDVRHLYGPFLAQLPPGGSILDAGCGSGRDSKVFKALGYQVTAIDASAIMAAFASRFIEAPVHILEFKDLQYEGQFDGIWACASLLHVPRAELREVLRKFHKALKPQGVCFVSFKQGEEERSEGEQMGEGRHFTDFTKPLFEEFLASHPDFSILDLWLTHDARPQRAQEVWLNALLEKRQATPG